MNGKQRGYLIVGLMVGSLAGSCPSHAQYTADHQTNVISGVTSNWVDNSSNPNAGYVVGSNWVNDVLLVNAGGVLSNGNGYVGYEVGADYNTVLVSDPGSAWTNNGTLYVGYSGSGNQLVIANGGAVYGGQLGYNATSSNNVAVVSGAGSTWHNVGHIGTYGSGNQLVIENGGVVHGGDLGYYGSSSNNVALVAGAGSTWYLGGEIGTYGSYNELVVSNGGAVYGRYGYLGGLLDSPSGSNNVVIVTGTGSVWSNTVRTCIGCGYGGNQKLMITDGGLVYDSSGVVAWESSNNTVVVSDPGSVWKNTGSIDVGYGGYGNQLIISNGGGVYVGDSTYIGATYAASNSVILVGNGSVLGTATNLYIGPAANGARCSNDQLIVSSGALVYDTNGRLGGDLSGNNLAVVTGPGSVWSNSANLLVGTNDATAGNQLVVTNGGAVYDNTGIVAGQGSRVFVVGNGATWRNQGSLYVGSYPGAGPYAGISNIVNIGTGGSLIASNLYVYPQGQRVTENGIIVSGGALFVTNSLHNGVLDLNFDPSYHGFGGYYGGFLTLNSGTVTVDSLVMTNFSPNSYTVGGVKFNGGVLSTKSTIISNDYSPYYFVFVVGNGTNNATLHLAPGGTGFHFFEAGLTISSNAMLKGVGTVIGATTVNAGGTLAPGDGPGCILFSNKLVLAAGSTLALTLNGPGAGQYSQIIGLGGLSVSNAVLNISLGYVPLPGDSFTIISNLTSSAILGTFLTTDGLALPNGADFVVDSTIFQIDYAANANGLDVVLTAMIPEPSSLLLTLLSALMLRAFVRRKRA
jgi:T5SS/PEP-CTERM-associated repeat protein